MQPTSTACPHCSTVLRIRDRKLVGRRIACPECAAGIEVVDNAGSFSVVAAVETTPQSSASPLPVARRKSKKAAGAIDANSPELDEYKPRERPVHSNAADDDPVAAAAVPAVLKSPVAVAWIVAGGVAILLIAVVVFWPTNSRSKTDGADGETANSTDALQDEPDVANDAPRDADAGGSKVDERLESLAELLKQYAAARGSFPAGTIRNPVLRPDQRLSWMAELADDGGVPVLRDRPWNDALNEAFVRRRMPAFQNPEVQDRAGAQGYPAAHFVGVAGVGEDGPSLPAHHHRAGVFGYDRATTFDDVSDGASNTLMVAGVTEQLGSWASGGPATVRPFTREPYVNGPDGFGTGAVDEMQVLTADGRVRTISKQTSPVVVRRMAAMNDGLPLDPEVPGEPGDARPPGPLVADGNDAPNALEPVAAPDPPEMQPAVPPNAVGGDLRPADPPEKIVDVQASLAQKVSSFRTSEPVEVERLLEDLEEMIGVPIRYDRKQLQSPIDRLKQTVILDLNNTTIEGVLKAALEKAGLAYKIESNEIQIRTPPTDGPL